jgi:predicted protein tyrosine phosphatase
MPPPLELIPGKLWIGSAMDARNKAFLTRAGITHILNCAGNEAQSPVSVRGPHIKYLQLNGRDSSDYTMLWHVDQFLPFLDDVFYGDPHNVVLVNCWAGLNRSVTVALAYLLLRHCADIGALADTVRAARPGALSNIDFVIDLMNLVEAVETRCHLD